MTAQVSAFRRGTATDPKADLGRFAETMGSSREAPRTHRTGQQPTLRAPGTGGEARTLRARRTGAQPTLRAPPASLPEQPSITWVGPMEVMIGGCRYRLVATTFVEPNETEGDVSSMRGGPTKAETVAPLTPRETQIARLVAQGYVNKEIASELSISEWTVSTHMRRIFAKLSVETRAAMVLRCFGSRESEGGCASAP